MYGLDAPIAKQFVVWMSDVLRMHLNGDRSAARERALMAIAFACKPKLVIATTPRFDRPGESPPPILAALTQRLAEEAHALDSAERRHSR